MKSKYGHRTINWFEAIVNKLGGEEAAEKFLRGELEVVVKIIARTFRQFVNYDLSVKELVKGCGEPYEEFINDQNFPSTEKGERKVEFALFQPGEDMTSEEVLSEMEKLNYRPATIKELLSFGNKNPELQRKLQIIALGSTSGFIPSWAPNKKHRLFVAMLTSNGGGSCRQISTTIFDSVWDHRFIYRFLAVRK